MKNLNDMSLRKVNDDNRKAYKTYSEEILEKKINKENVLAKHVCDPIVKSVMDVTKFIALVIPKIEKSSDKIIIEKYLQGYSLTEIGKIVGKKPQHIDYRVKKYSQLLKDTFQDQCAIKDLFNGTEEFLPQGKKILVEKDIAKARMILENDYGYETFIYPFDIFANSYKITLKHPITGTLKLTQKGILDFVKALQEKKL